MNAGTELVHGPVATLDVSRPAPATWMRKTIGILGDLGLAVVLVLLAPAVVVIGAPLVFLAWVIVVIAQRHRSHAK